jgi:glycosyltransferase involved in cell wall biosynthesis
VDHGRVGVGSDRRLDGHGTVTSNDTGSGGRARISEEPATFLAMRPGPEEGGTSLSMLGEGVEIVDSFGAGDEEAGPSHPLVSVIVATRDRAAFLPDLVEALAHQSMESSRYEVVVVDDGSTDDTWITLEALAQTSALRLSGLRLQHSVGQGPARNIGVRASRGELLAFTDDDCIPGASWLSAITGPFLGAEGAAPHVVVQGKTEAWPEDDSYGPWARTVWVLRPTWLFETCNVAYRRCDVELAGGFPGRDEAPSGPGGKLIGEDAILGWRVIEQGAQLRFEPGALVHHRHLPATFYEWLQDQAGRGAFPGLVRRSHVARRALWHGVFLAPRTAAYDLALASLGLAVATRRRRWLLGLVPWIWLALPEAADRGGRHPVIRLAQLALGDQVGASAMVKASWGERRLVL